MSKTELVGRIGVDAGIVMIGDPCYQLHKTAEELQCSGFAGDWQQFVDLLDLNNAPDTIPIGPMAPTGSARAIVVGGFGGDGIFPVYIRRDAEGAVSELIVRFKR